METVLKRFQKFVLFIQSIASKSTDAGCSISMITAMIGMLPPQLIQTYIQNFTKTNEEDTLTKFLATISVKESSLSEDELVKLKLFIKYFFEITSKIQSLDLQLDSQNIVNLQERLCGSESS